MFAPPWSRSSYVDVSSKADVKARSEFVERPIYFYDWDILIAHCFETYDSASEHSCD